MTRPAVLAFGIGGLGLALLAILAAGGGQAVLPACLAAWLVVLAVPAGALPLVMAHDLSGRADTPLAAALRALLPAMLPAAVLAFPILIALSVLVPAAGPEGFAAAWMAPGAMRGRAIAILLAWVVLARMFGKAARPESRRPAWAAAGLMLHLVIGTLAAGDWVAAVDPGLHSSSLGLTVLVAQAGMALSVACLASLQARTDAGAAMLLLLAAWLFLHFTQYLVVWSANLPGEVVWYLRRNGGPGQSGEIGALVLFGLALLALRPTSSARIVAVFAALVLVLHGAEMFWLVVPASRGHFSLRLADLAALAGLAGPAAGVALLLRGRRGPGERLGHGEA